MVLEGKGFFIWKIDRCEEGHPAAIARRAKAAGLSHVILKIADGSRAYNVDLAEGVADALRGMGIRVWGWQYVYGREPYEEADIAIHRHKLLKLDGFVVNAETEYKGKFAEAAAYMERLRAGIGDLPVALSSFRYPFYHPELPWSEFLSRCDYNMPQVYWVQAHNPAEQLDRCISQFQEIYPIRPILPTGAAFEEFGWRPDTMELVDFMNHARTNGLPGINFWSWDYAGSMEGEDFWHLIASFTWPVVSKPITLPDRMVSLLNRGDAEGVAKLYRPDATLVIADTTLTGQDAIRAYYQRLLTTHLPGASFIFEIRHSEGTIWQLKWKATGATNGQIMLDAQDTLVLRRGLIQYHSSVYPAFS